MFLWVVLALSLSCVSSLIYDYLVLSQSYDLSRIMNSDTLLPVDMARSFHANPSSWRTFQWPRVPSLFPDMIYFLSAERLGLDWRRSFLGYTFVIIAMAGVALGTVIWGLRREGANATGRRKTFGEALALGALTVNALVLVALATAQVSWITHWEDLLLAFVPVVHGDGLWLGLMAGPIAISAHRGNRTARHALLGLCALGTFCDLLFVSQFLVPFALVTRAPVLRQVLAENSSTEGGRPRWRALGRKVIARDIAIVRDAALACAIGWAATLLLYRQSVLEVPIRSPMTKLSGLVRDWQAAPWAIAILAMTFAMAWLAWGEVRRLVTQPMPDPAEERRAMLFILGATSALLSLCLLALLYLDPPSWRYALPALWWPLAAGMAALWHVARLSAWGTAAACGIAILAGIRLPDLRRAPDLLTWRSSLESCIASHAPAAGMQAGLATFWNTRLVEASSDWRLRIGLIDEFGFQRVWGTDAGLYRQTNFTFIIISADVNQRAIVLNYGRPARTLVCPDAPVWIYARPLSVSEKPEDWDPEKAGVALPKPPTR